MCQISGLGFKNSQQNALKTKQKQKRFQSFGWLLAYLKTKPKGSEIVTSA